jgi:hypothetical protein
VGVCDSRSYIRTTNENITAEQWGITLVMLHWKNIITMWLQRNEDHLGRTDEERSKTSTRKTDLENYITKETSRSPRSPNIS